MLAAVHVCAAVLFKPVAATYHIRSLLRRFRGARLKLGNGEQETQKVRVARPFFALLGDVLVVSTAVAPPAQLQIMVITHSWEGAIRFAWILAINHGAIRLVHGTSLKVKWQAFPGKF